MHWISTYVCCADSRAHTCTQTNSHLKHLEALLTEPTQQGAQWPYRGAPCQRICPIAVMLGRHQALPSERALLRCASFLTKAGCASGGQQGAATAIRRTSQWEVCCRGGRTLACLQRVRIPSKALPMSQQQGLVSAPEEITQFICESPCFHHMLRPHQLEQPHLQQKKLHRGAGFREDEEPGSPTFRTGSSRRWLLLTLSDPLCTVTQQKHLKHTYAVLSQRSYTFVITQQLAVLKGWTLVPTPDAVPTKRRNSLTRMSAPPLARTSPQPLSPRTPTKSLSAKGEIQFCFISLK